MLGIFANHFPRADLASTFDAVAAHGLTAVQFDYEGGAPEPIRAAIEQRGLTLAAVSGTYNMAHPDAAIRTEGGRWLDEMIVAAPKLGTKVVTLCTGSRDADDMWRAHADNDSAEAWADLRRSLEPALETAQRHRVTLAVEPEHGNVIVSPTAARRLLDELQTPHLKIIIDPANVDLNADALREAFDLLGEDLVLAHAKDRRHDGTVVPAGHGDVDYNLYLELLRDCDVPLILHGLAEHEVPDAVAFLRRQGEAP